MQLNLVVLRAADPSALADFYGQLGLKFVREQHGQGPEHFACSLEASVFEIYPLASPERDTTAVRLGFSVPDVVQTCRAAVGANGKLLSGARIGPFGKRATIQDPAGHSIDLVEAGAF
jgi:predicted enzyme related to lactoylglutathione lyase